ncbi:MAG TPA: LysR family transcriptional regulator [Caulobacteraceae bacterium]|nr:LysR family transcriptional regulator [Caulobacteraceae bacterium]
MAQEPDWDLWRSFLAVLKAGSLSAAARALGIAQPTVGRHIEALEQGLGAALFTRSPAGFKPTETALSLQGEAEAMASAAAALARTASGAAGEVKGAVRITASDIVGAEVLPPILADFTDRWREVEIELVLSNRLEDLLRRDADIAVRMAAPSQDALVARRIGDVPLRLYAHRSYLQRRGEPRTVEDLPGHTFIGYDRQPIPGDLGKHVGIPVDRGFFAFRSDSELGQLAAMRSGLGVCACQAPLAARDPNLVPILHDALQLSIPMYVVMHEDLKSTRRMRLLFDHLVEGLRDYLAE